MIRRTHSKHQIGADRRLVGAVASAGCAALTFLTSLLAGADVPRTEPSLPSSLHAAVPQPAGAPDPRDAALLAECGAGDASLHTAAEHVVERARRRLPALDMHRLSEVVVASGSPHVRTRTWTLTAPRIARDDALRRLRAWLAAVPRAGVRRCGVASVVDSESGESIAVVATDVEADLRQPIPRRVRTGAWVTVDATMAAGASGAKAVVLGPRGAPRTIPTSFDPATRQVVARFMADVVGRWVVQVLATTSRGPLPVLEAEVFAGRGGSTQDRVPSEAPGETATGSDDASTLTAMLNAARGSERLVALARDSRLDAAAAKHARAMMAKGAIAHDAGAGDPVSRVADAGIHTTEAGENVAHAASLALAHRALWASPSHRANLLHSRYTRVGVAVVRDGAGRVWVTQLFAGRDAAPSQ